MGQCQLNAYKPLMTHEALNSAERLVQSLNRFIHLCIVPLRFNEAAIKAGVENSLMLVTNLNNAIGYSNAAVIAKYCYRRGLTLRQVLVSELHAWTDEQYDKHMDARTMVSPGDLAEMRGLRERGDDDGPKADMSASAMARIKALEVELAEEDAKAKKDKEDKDKPKEGEGKEKVKEGVNTGAVGNASSASNTTTSATTKAPKTDTSAAADLKAGDSTVTDPVPPASITAAPKTHALGPGVADETPAAFTKATGAGAGTADASKHEHKHGHHSHGHGHGHSKVGKNEVDEKVGESEKSR
jgi:hypothetical protein